MTTLPNVKDEQLLFITLDFKPFKRCNDRRTLLIEQGGLVASKVVLLKALL